MSERKSFIEKAKETVVGLGLTAVALLVVFAIFGAVAGTFNLVVSSIAAESEGVVSFSNCREQIYVQEDTLRRYFSQFTCDIQRTETGKIMSGTCVNIKLADDGSGCTTAYIYEKQPEVKCPTDMPYLSYDEMCYGVWDYGRVNTNVDPNAR
jgi:hypothetical protein